MGPGRKIEKPKDFKKTLKRLIKSLKKYYLPLTIILICSILGTIFTIIGPKVLGNATTELFNGVISKINGGSGINFSKLNSIIITIFILYIISALFNYLQGILMANISQRYTENLRKKVNRKIEKLPISYFDHKDDGEVLSLITNDIDVINQNLNRSFSEIITSLTMVIGIIIMMISINLSMTLISIIILPISGIISGIIVNKSQKHFKDRQERLSLVNSRVEEILSSFDVVKAFNSENKMLSELKKENNKLYESSFKSNFLGGIMQPIMSFVGNIGYVIVAILGGLNVVRGKITVGNIQSFITYTKNFTNPIAALAGNVTEIQSMIAASERVFEFLDLEEEYNLNETEVLENVKGKVEFKNVTFGYTEDKIVINDFSSIAKAGQKIAIVGPTGAGKTTLVKLLMRFYDVNSGEILLDGININKIKKEDLRKNFGMVLQDTWLFSGTIMENLRYGKLDATDDEVINAAKLAHVHHFIKTLPGAYNMELNEEVNNISEGQKQLLTIARAILANPPLLILDEATSSVDTRTEELIQKAMDTLMKNRTSFIIAHRLSTIKNADLILVLNNGDIVEKGTHDELIKKGGFYSELYNSQFEIVD